MSVTDIQVTICGSAGDGTIAAGDILKNTMAAIGFKAIAFDLFPAEIRGFGKCVSRTRISSEPVYTLKPEADVLISLDDSHALAHIREAREFGVVIHEESPLAPAPEGRQVAEYIEPGHLPYQLQMRTLSEQTTNSPRSRNMVALGFLAGLLDMPRAAFHDTIGRKFRTKAKAVTTQNVAAFDAGFDAALAKFKLDDVRFQAPADGAGRGAAIMTTGNEAIVRGCLDAGIDSFFGYPITPASSILEMLAKDMPKRGGRVLQTEDEISAVGATIGAGYTGSRAATSTSGPGLALMTEMIGLGVMGEIPCVLLVSQRGGPSTGMPTKTEQSDLNLAVYGGSGDARRLVVAPSNVYECYELAGYAFELAETFQTPVIVLLDLYLSNRHESVTLPAAPPFALTAGKGVSERDPDAPYRRYAGTPDSISPRAIPGEAGGVHTITGLEHGPEGRPSDSADNHAEMNRKRHDKLHGALAYRDLAVTERHGDAGEVDVGVLTWGSSYGEALEAMKQARAEGIRCAAMKVKMLSPLPTAAIEAFMDDCGAVLVPELNHEGQFATLVMGQIGRPVARLSYTTGEPMRPADILREIRRLAEGRGPSMVAQGSNAAE